MQLATNVQIRQLSSPTDVEVESITRVLMAAFYDDPGVQASLAGLHTKEHLYHTFFLCQVRALAHSGEMWIAENLAPEDEGKRVVGVAGWFEPGRMLLDTEEQREAARVNEFLDMLPKDLQEWWASYVFHDLHRGVANS